MIYQNKKAVSTIIATVLMVALVMVIAGVVWVVVSNLVSNQLQEAGTCLEVMGKVSINAQYTCYNSTGKELRFSIGMGDIDVDKVLVSISGEGTTKSYEIGNEAKVVNTNLTTYTYNTNIKLPNKNEGLTYRLNTSREGFAGKLDSIKIYPIVGGQQCDVSDTISDISDCLVLT